MKRSIVLEESSEEGQVVWRCYVNKKLDDGKVLFCGIGSTMDEAAGHWLISNREELLKGVKLIRLEKQ